MRVLRKKFFCQLIFLVIFFFFSFSNFIFAGDLTHLKDRLNRLKENLPSGIEHLVVFKTQTAVSGGPGNNKVVISFPSSDDYLWCRVAGTLLASGCNEDGANPLPGSLSAVCSQADDKILISGVDNLSASTSYCVKITENGTGLLGTPAASTKGIITVTTNDGTSDVDSGILVVDILPDDQVILTATVPSVQPPPSGGISGSVGYLTQVVFLGKTLPNVFVVVLKDGQRLARVKSDSKGNFRVGISGIAPGLYLFSLYAQDEEGNTSPPLVFSVLITPGVTSTISGIFLDFKKKATFKEADLNKDGRVDLVDFSIMVFWYQKSDFPKEVDLNSDGKVDLADFSILGYYWTG